MTMYALRMEKSMKRVVAFAFVILITLGTAMTAHAQTAESIWLTANTTAYKTGETVFVTLNASSATPIQGFTFQIRYDPACLKPVNASSPIQGMNGLPLPQLTGLVDGSYASTTPQSVNGILAEVRFTALRGCQSGLFLESAALAIRNEKGFAVPLSTVSIGERDISLYIDKETGGPQPAQVDMGSILPLDPPKAAQGFPGWIIGGMFVFLTGLLMFGTYKLFGIRKTYVETPTKPSPGNRRAALHIKHGPHAGKSYALNKFPVQIGRDPRNDICINDPYVIGQHAQIFSERNGYYLRDLGGRTFINGRPVRSSAVVLQKGDVVRLGKSVLFVFR
jgi:hypothetical protein